MKASDLMVGDWVLDTYTNKPMKIEGINGGNPRFGQDLEPIPLTPEILEKNGLLDPAHSEYYVRYDRHDEEWYFIYYGSFAEVKVSITAVHELQHCLKLVGISKEIEL